jgi:hypothetical protein
LTVPLASLTAVERDIVHRCIRAIATGRFISEEAFHPILGVTPQEAGHVSEEWSQLDESSEIAQLVINNSLNGLLIWYGWQDEDPDAADRTLLSSTGATSSELERIFAKWRGSQPAT